MEVIVIYGRNVGDKVPTPQNTRQISETISFNGVLPLFFFYLSHLESWHYSYLERIFSIVFNL